MEHRKDFLEREIQKLILLLSSLVEKISNVQINDLSKELQKTDELLGEEFNLSLDDVCTLEELVVKDRIKKMHAAHIEKLIQLLNEVIKKSDLGEIPYNKEILIKRTLLLIDFLDNMTNVFSFERLHLKNSLQERL